MEKIIETKVCKCWEKFNITDKDLEFYDKVSPIFNWIKYSISSPTLCPDCRQQRRLSFRNERKLYKRKCDLTWKDVISIYSQDKPYKVYEQSEWWSDKWNPIDYNMDYDFSRPFFGQFEELQKSIPHPALLNKNIENSEYWNLNTDLKNCYLCFASGFDEDSMFLTTSAWCKNLLDWFWAIKSENSFEILDSSNCYNSIHVKDSENINNSAYIINCRNIANSLMCVWIRWKEYCFLNQQYSKSDYEVIKTKIAKNRTLFLESYKKFYDLIKQTPFTNKIINSFWCSWDYIKNSHNCVNCYDCIECTDCKYCAYIWFNATNCYDCSWDVFQTELSYESSIIPFWHKIFSSYNCWNCSNVLLSLNNYESSNLFWCIWLRNKEYCILNKQYNKEEYEELVPKIIEHMKKAWEWWEFFPSSISPFGYNETVANEYYPITIKTGLKENINYIDNEWNTYNSLDEIQKRPVFKYSTYEAPFPKVDKTIPADKLPDNIKDIPDDILNWAIECEFSWKPFRIIKQELEFYRKHNLPVPRRHPDIRYMDRMKLRNPRKLYDRKCDKCSIDIKTTFAPDRPEIVYCEECYNKEII